MVIGFGYVVVEIPAAHSLKEKRRVIRSIIQRAQSRFNVSIAEVDYQENWQMSGIGMTCVSNSSVHADEMVAKIIQFIELNLKDGYIADIETDIMHLP